MMTDARLQKMLDEHEVNQVLLRWGQSRDRGDWDALRNCFHPDGTIHISWISATGYEFAEKSKAMLASHRDGEYTKHIVGGALINVAGQRATSMCHINLHGRTIIDDVEFDREFWGQFFDLFEKRDDGVWRIVKRTMVYEKDRLDPVNPSDLAEGFFNEDELREFPRECRFLCWQLKKRGGSIIPDIVSVNSPEEEALKDEMAAWLAAA